MLSDRKIKKLINKELKPTVSAVQFCLDAGITFDVQKTTKEVNRKSWFAKVFLPIASVTAVCLSIVLPLTLVGNGGTVDQPKYGENDVEYEKTVMENLYADEQIKMFNKAYVQREGTPYLITPRNGNMKLGYNISDIIYAEVIDGVPSFAVTFDYLIKCYDGYTISSVEFNSNMDKIYTQNDISFSYSIVENSKCRNAYITFKYKKSDYYIHVRNYGQITEICDDSVQLFLRKAFSEEKQSDEIISGRQIDS